jgi:hemerythrin
MSPQWTQDLSIGVEWIDGQHKELFNRINNLHDAIKQGKGKEEIINLIRFLDNYVVMHFSSEEKYMTKYDYPEYPSHKSAHKWFIREFSTIKSELEDTGSTSYLVLRINHLLGDWLITHIMKVDKAFGIFLKTKLSNKK